MEDRDGDVWFNMTSGMLWIDGKSDRRKYLWPLVKEEPLSLYSVAISSQERVPGEIWASLNGAGLLKTTFEPCERDHCDGPKGKEMRLERFVYDPANPRSLNVDMSTYLAVDQQQRLWCGTAQGLAVCDPATQNFDRILPILGNPESLRHQSIYSLYADQKGIVWAGTRDGLSYYSPLRKPFRRFYQSPNSAMGLNSNPVEALFEDSSGDLWVSTPKGVSRWHVAADTFTHYPSRVAPNKGTNGIVKHFHKDESGHIWMSSQHALVKLDPKTRIFEPFPFHPTEFCSHGTRNLFDILPDGDRRFWIGSYDGILYFDRKTAAFTPFEHPTNWFALDLHRDRLGTFWAAGGRELYQFDPITGTFPSSKAGAQIQRRYTWRSASRCTKTAPAGCGWAPSGGCWNWTGNVSRW